MAETLFIDGRAGAAGDMLLAALIDVGASPTAVRRALRSLPLDGWTLAVRRIERGGLALRNVRVRARPGRHRRTWPAIRRVLRGGELPPPARDRALAVFRRLFEAEAAVHGADPQRVHLHEAGAVDAIIDIAGCCVALDLLGWPEIVASRLTTGFGRVRCAHGVYPVPAPATLELLRGVPVEAGAVEAERTTPTGAALLVELADSWGEMPAMLPRTIGYGAGDRDVGDDPNALRAVLGERAGGPAEAAPVTVTECDLDDENPQTLAETARRLLAAGALDVTLGALTMKKGRLGTRVGVVSRPADAGRLAEMLLTDTRTLGVRQRPETRVELPREALRVRTRYGVVRVKRATLPDGSSRYWPEHDDCAAVAERRGLRLETVRREALRAARDKRDKRRKR